MSAWTVPWLEIAIALPLAGAALVSRSRPPARAFAWGLACSGATLACAALACLGHYLGEGEVWTAQPGLFGREPFGLDELSAPLVPLVALLHFLTYLATGRTKMRRFSLALSLASEAIRLATFGCRTPWLLAALLAADIVPAYAQLRQRGRATRVYLLHLGLFVGLLGLGGAFLGEGGHEAVSAWATVPLLAAVAVRCGIVPVHCWLTDWFEHASFGNALLFVMPLTGVYAALRLAVPLAPDWALTALGVGALVTAVYAAALAAVQDEARRFFAFLFLSHASLVLVGVGLHSVLGLTGALALWVSVTLSLGGFGLTLRALEARFGRLSLRDFHGLYDNSPMLAVCFLLTGLASVGFPGTLGFLAAELLVDGVVEASPFVGVGVVVAAAINGIAVMRAYFLLFTGARHSSTVSLRIGPRERFAVLTLAALILGGGLFPQPGVSSRYRAAREVLDRRRSLTPPQALGGAAASEGPRGVEQGGG